VMKWTLDVHISKNHEKSHMYQCDQCGYQTAWSGSLKRHTNEVHLNIRNHHCDKCSKSFKNQKSLEMHLYSVHKAVLDDSTMERMQKWKKCLQNKEAKPVFMKCLRCEKQDFKTIKEFNEHTKQCYRYNQILKSVKFKCNLCESNWSTSEVLHYHLYSEHNSPAVVCDVCGTIIQNHYYLEKHIDRVHRKTKAFQCEKCDKNFTTKNGLDRHTKNVHLKIKPYTCDLCDMLHLYLRDLKLMLFLNIPRIQNLSVTMKIVIL